MKIVSCLLNGMLLAAALFGDTGNRARTENTLSPWADTSMTLQGQVITIEYSAPSARKRQVEGGLIPYDRYWRLGADAATTLTSEADITIGDLRVPKGVHTLYLVATGDNDWRLVVNNQTGQWGTTYDQSKDLGRVPMKLEKVAQPIETLSIRLTPTGESEGTLTIAWGRTRATAPVKVAAPPAI